MSDIGRVHRPEVPAADAAELAEQEVPGAGLQDPATTRALAGDELKYRVSGGASGVAPMQRLMNERRAIGGQLATRVQRKADGGGTGEVAIPEHGGEPLSRATRQRFEGKLGADLSDVRVHTGADSAQAAAGLGARAFTVGNDVHFNAGEFAPGSKEGDRLLAHELTHAVQGQRSGVQRKPAAAHDSDAGGKDAGAEVSHPDEPAEKEADAVADGVTEQLHGGKDAGKHKDKDREKDKDKDKDKDAHAGGHDAAGAQAFPGGGDAPGGAGGHETVAHEAAHVVQQGGGHEGGGAAAPAEKPAPISAKYVGIGRKIFRQPTRAPSAGGAPAAGGATAPPAAAGAAPSSTKAKTPEETLSSPEYKQFEQRYLALLANLQMPADAAGAQKLWLDVVRTLQSTNPAFQADANKVDPANPKSRTNLESATSQKIIAQFDPIVAQLTPMMQKFTQGKRIYGFWSGRAADAIARANSEVSLEKSALGSLFDGINVTGSWDIQMWAALSRAYATHAAKDAEKKTYRGFVGMGSSSEMSIFNKIEQPQFAQMLDQKAAASIHINWYAVAFDPSDPQQKKPDDTCNVAGMSGVIGSGADRASMVQMAEDVNAKRVKAFQKTGKVVAPGQVDAVLAEADKAAPPAAAASGSGNANAPAASHPPAPVAGRGAAPPSNPPKKT